MPKVVVITPTVGTKYIQQAIDSVSNQTIECVHYIVNDGKTDFFCRGGTVINLPENTGRADGLLWNGHRIYAGLPFMVNADYVLFLDEDNWFEPNHVESMVNYCEENKLDWCYSLRRIVTEEGEYVCNDDCESLGKEGAFYNKSVKFVDTNCFCIKGKILPSVSPHFYVPAIGDRPFSQALMEQYPNFDCTGLYTVNYRARPNLIEMFKQGNQIMKDQKPSIFIATPMYGGMCAGYYTQSVMELNMALQSAGIVASYSFMFNESLITRARNALTKGFLNSNNTHLMFIDSDIKFRPADIIKMLDADMDIICGIYPKKEINWNTIKKAVESGVPEEQLKNYTGSFVVNLVDYQGEVTVPIDKPVEIFNGGTGFMLIKREVFEQLADKVPTYYNDVNDLNGQIGVRDEIKEYFATSIEPETGRLLSEDYHFCYIWRKMGGKVHAAPWCQLSHIGSYAFDGQLIPAP